MICEIICGCTFGNKLLQLYCLDFFVAYIAIINTWLFVVTCNKFHANFRCGNCLGFFWFFLINYEIIFHLFMYADIFIIFNIHVPLIWNWGGESKRGIVSFCRACKRAKRNCVGKLAHVLWLWKYFATWFLFCHMRFPCPGFVPVVRMVRSCAVICNVFFVLSCVFCAGKLVCFSWLLDQCEII